MKKSIFFVAVFVISSLCSKAQTSYHITWQMGISNAEASKTIQIGDTVFWEVIGGHTVTTDAGSTESFNSGSLSTGDTYSHVFTQVGSNPYHCSFHSSMIGTIIVKGTTGVENVTNSKLTISPNPASDWIHVKLLQEKSNLEVFDLNGKRVYNKQHVSGNHQINVSNWKSGEYIIKTKHQNGYSIQKVLVK